MNKRLCDGSYRSSTQAYTPKKRRWVKRFISPYWGAQPKIARKQKIKCPHCGASVYAAVIRERIAIEKTVIPWHEMKPKHRFQKKTSAHSGRKKCLRFSRPQGRIK